MQEKINNISEFKKILAALLIFIIFFIVFFFPIIKRDSFIGGDFLFGFPLYFNGFLNLEKLQILQWNPYNLSGTPDMFSSFIISYLPNWFFASLLNTNNIGYSYLIIELMSIFHIFLTAIFTYLLARYLKISFWGAIISGLIFSLSGYLAYKAMYPTMIFSVIWLPIIFLFFHRGLNQKNFRDIAISSFFMAMSALGGHQQMPFYIGLFLFFYTLFYIYTEYKKNITKKNFKNLISIVAPPLKKLLFIAFITVGSLAITTLPTLNYVAQTWHGPSTPGPIGSSLSPLFFLFTQIIPHYFGGQNQTEIYYGNWPIIELASYVGIISLILSFIAIINLLLKNNIVKFLLIAMVFFLMFAFGVNSPIYLLFYYFVPLFKNFSTPSRALLFFVFPIALLAGFGLTVIMEKMTDSLKRKINLVINFLLVSFFVFGTIIAFLSFYDSGSLVKDISLSHPGTNFMDSSVIFQDYSVLLLIILLVYLVMKKWFSGTLKKSVFVVLIITILFIDLFAASSGFYSSKDSIDPREYYKRTPAIDFLDKQDKTDYRFVSNNLLNDSLDTLYKIPSTEQLAVANFRYEEYAKGHFGSFMGKMNIISGNRLNLLNARYLMFEKPPEEGNYQKIDSVDNLYQNLDALPRLFLVHKAETITAPDKILKRIDDKKFNPRQTIILENVPPLNSAADNNLNEKDKAVFTYYSPDQIEIYTYSQNSALLFLSEMYYPGWKAFVDGVPVGIYRANYLFRSVYLDKGPHSVKMIFDPEDFKLGRNITIATLLILLAYFLIDIVRHRKFEGYF